MTSIVRRINILCFSSLFFIMGCMSSKREEELQHSITELRLSSERNQSELAKIREELAKKELALGNIKNNSEIASRSVQGTKSEVDDLKRQLSMTQGALDELQTRLARLLESTTKIASEESIGVRFSEFEISFTSLERRIGYLELEMNAREHKGKGTIKYQSSLDLENTLKSFIENKEFKKIIIVTTSVLNADVSPDFFEVALRYRGEAFFMQQNYSYAALSLGEFTETFIKHPKRARSLLLAGDCFVYLNRRHTAKAYYTECYRIAADKEEGKACKDRLNKI